MNTAEIVIFLAGIITLVPLLRFSQYKYNRFYLYALGSLACSLCFICFYAQPWHLLYLYYAGVGACWIYFEITLFTCNFGYVKRKEASGHPIEPNQAIDLILPIYNPYEGFEDIIEEYFKKLCDLFPQRHIRLMITNDGSKRNFGPVQIQRLEQISPDVLVIDNKENHGKGYALRKGVSTSTAPLVVYTDYDFPFTLDSMERLIHALDKGSDIVIGTRDDSYEGMLPVLRRLYSTFSHYMNRFFLGLKYRDTQGGLKGFNATGKDLFLKTSTKQFLFDTEFIYRASLDTQVLISDVAVRVRENVYPSNMGLKIILIECINFFKFISI